MEPWVPDSHFEFFKASQLIPKKLRLADHTPLTKVFLSNFSYPMFTFVIQIRVSRQARGRRFEDAKAHQGGEPEVTFS